MAPTGMPDRVTYSWYDNGDNDYDHSGQVVADGSEPIRPANETTVTYVRASELMPGAAGPTAPPSSGEAMPTAPPLRIPKKYVPPGGPVAVSSAELAERAQVVAASQARLAIIHQRMPSLPPRGAELAWAREELKRVREEFGRAREELGRAREDMARAREELGRARGEMDWASHRLNVVIGVLDRLDAASAGPTQAPAPVAPPAPAHTPSSLIAGHQSADSLPVRIPESPPWQAPTGNQPSFQAPVRATAIKEEEDEADTMNGPDQQGGKRPATEQHASTAAPKRRRRGRQ